MTAAPVIHPHVPARTVLLALVVTLLAAGIELAGARRSASLFLAADAVHLVAHLGIFLVLLIPTATWHERGEDFVTNAVLVLILLIALGIARPSVEQLSVALHEPPRPSFMLLSRFGGKLDDRLYLQEPCQDAVVLSCGAGSRAIRRSSDGRRTLRSPCHQALRLPMGGPRSIVGDRAMARFLVAAAART